MRNRKSLFTVTSSDGFHQITNAKIYHLTVLFIILMNGHSEGTFQFAVCSF